MTRKLVLDQVDEQIIGLLQDNGRLSNRAIGRHLNLSEGAIRKRLKRAIEGGAISYGAVVDISVTGLTASGWLSVRCSAAKARDVAQYIAGMELCSMCALTSGEFAIRAYIYATDLHALAGTIEQISRQAGVSGVRFRQAVGHSRHRYEYVILPEDATVARWSARGVSE